MASTTHPQPVRRALILADMSVTQAAEKIGVTWSHLYATVIGRTTPSEVVRQRLPELLGIPLEELYDADLLARTYAGPRRGTYLAEVSK